ncbi:hypothetical protein LNP74_05965 [Klebsiella pneumoniae subsp. pneumoniae]|nr:hypothetical protein [Klebsiella pneumoniae subsp. pneumoniae]
MQKKHLAFDELFDVRAVRIVAERLQDRVYAALGIVHTHYRHLPDEFDDFTWPTRNPTVPSTIHTCRGAGAERQDGGIQIPHPADA